jgi:hypothetical protein
VQGVFVSDISKYSGISVLDRQSLEKVLKETESGIYTSSADFVELGKIAQVTSAMTGSITKTTTGYALQIAVTDTSSGITKASHSSNCTIAEFDNFTGIRRASLDLLTQLGVELTAQARSELSAAVTTQAVSAQTALAQGIVAQRGGTEVAALSYYYQAATLDTSLLEAAGRATVMSADISSGNIGNIGANVRNDIQWRRAWIDRLTESERYFDNFFKASSLPYTLFYSTEIKQGTINYQTETANLSIDVNLHSSGVWTYSVEKALEAVYQGLDATKRKSDWGLAGWPATGVTNLKPFVAGNKSFAINAELLNDRNQVIGRQNFTVRGSWSWKDIKLNVSTDDTQTVTFTNVKAADMTDRLTIRIASVNGASAQSAAQSGALQIRAISGNEFNKWRDDFDFFSFSSSTITGVNPKFLRVNTRKNIPGIIWGDPVIGIGKKAFDNGASYHYLGFGEDHRVIFPDGLTFIGDYAFNSYSYALYSIDELVFPNSLVSIGDHAFEKVNKVIIGANVSIGEAGAYTDWGSIKRAYERNSKQAGVYLYNGSYSPR